MSNKERNAIEFRAWKTYVSENHPSVHSDDVPPDNVLFIECLIESENKQASSVMHDIVHTRLGDDGIKQENTKKGGGAKITPVMRCYPGSLHIVNTNDYLAKKKVGNGSQCKCKQVKLKPGARRVWKNWDRHKVYTVSIQDVEYVEFYHRPSPPKGASTTFQLKPERVGATIDFPLSSHKQGIRIKLGKVKVTQVPVNCNIATTGHKLQGTSKDSLIVNSWSYTFANWVYVVLSRVRTRSGLLLNKKLDLKKKLECQIKCCNLKKE